MAGAAESRFSKLVSSTCSKAIQAALLTNDTTSKIFAHYRAGLNDLTSIMLRYHGAVNNGEPAWETVGRVPSDIQVQHATAMQRFKAVAEIVKHAQASPTDQPKHLLQTLARLFLSDHLSSASICLAYLTYMTGDEDAAVALVCRSMLVVSHLSLPPQHSAALRCALL